MGCVVSVPSGDAEDQKSALARIIRNPTRKRGNPASFLAY
ncbi:MAG: hypothetical protein ACI9G1_002034, partial [Pirellulaceae bacterium]